MTIPRTSHATAARAEAWIATEVGRAAVTRAVRGRVVLPIVRHGGVEAHVADVFEVETPGAPGRWEVYVGADGTPLARRSTIATASGTLRYNAGVRYASGPRQDVAASTAAITVDGAATVTGADGTFTWPTSVTATVAPTCTGTSVIVDNAAGANATASLSIPPGGATTWNVANIELDDAQVSTYVYGSIVLAADRLIDPGLPFLAGPVTFYVNEDMPCNAYSTGTDVHLARATSTCENTGRVADIVFHEFGHSFHSHEIIPGMGAFDSALTEGLADFNAANVTEDSGIGRGLDFTDAAVREIDPTGIEKTYPADVVLDPHVTGEILSGALWDLRAVLVAELGHDPGVAATDAIFLGVMRRAADLPTSYTAALIADDDDADLGNGTPHGCEIERAFGIHGLVPGYQETVVSSPVVDQLAIAVPVSTPVGTTCPVRHVTSMHVLWKIGDGIANELQLEDHGDTWTGAFPDQPEGTVISYSVDVTFDDGGRETFPDNPADPLYETFVGHASVIYCQTFDHDPGWIQSGTFDDEWQWGTPNPVASHSGDPLAPHTGTHVVGTNVVSGGSYRANEVTTIETPEIDVSAYQIVHLQYWRWLTVEDAMYDQAEVLVNDTPIWHNAGDANGTLDHLDREWRFHDFDLTPHVPDGTARVGWRLQSDGVYQLGGWNLDDVCLVGLTKIPRCGDAYLDVGEQCDDGATKDGDGCSASCRFEIVASGGGCGVAGGRAGLPLALVVLGLVRRRRRRRPTTM